MHLDKSVVGFGTFFLVMALIVPPGRGRATAIAGAAALTVAGGRGALVVVPAKSHAVHRAGQLASRLRPLGVCVETAHGLLPLAARDRLDEMLRVEIYRRGLHSDAFANPALRPVLSPVGSD